MEISRTLLDTDALSAVLRVNPAVTARAREYLGVYPQLEFSIVTRYEILRGLKAKGAAVQLQDFEAFCAKARIHPVTDAIIVRAADIYAALHRRGELIGDADILIAATAMEHRLVLNTNNGRHYGRIEGLGIENWLEG